MPRATQRYSDFTDPQGSAVIGACQFPGCDLEGSYRAPMSREQLNRYRWFCLEHIRLYNQSWDFFKGMNEQQIERQRRADAVWLRETWPLGQDSPRSRRWRNPGLDDTFGIFGDRTARAAPAPPANEHSEALSVLGLKPPASFEEVRAKYRALVKKLHPDANGGDVAAENRLKDVTRAYSSLKTAHRHSP